MKKIVKNKYVKLSLVLLGMLLLLVYVCNLWVTQAAANKNSSDLNQVPVVKVGLLLGTGKYLSNGTINSYYRNRIEATVALYKNQRIKSIVISGDNSREGYDEPTDMRADLIQAGVDSNQIYLDYAGFRTFDSMVRLKEIFQQDSCILISQQFHNERAIYIGNKINLYCYGYNAKDVDKYFGFKTMVREKLARVKVVLDFMIGVEPKFLGEKIDIP